MESTELEKNLHKMLIREGEVKRVEIGFNRGIIEIDRGSGGGRGREEFAERNESASMYTLQTFFFV